MPAELRASQALKLWEDVVFALVRDGEQDLTLRQMAVLLTVYLEPPPHTVRGLAEKLGVTKPVVTRALDTMGRLGLLTAQVLRNAGCQVRLIGKHPEKLALCEKWQIRSRLLSDIAPRHDQDIVVDCTGSAGGFELAMQMVRPRGTIVLKSTVAQGKPLNLAPLVIDEITVVGSRCGPFREAIRALADGTVDVLSLISRRMKLEQGVEALAVAGRAGVLKVILSMT